MRDEIVGHLVFKNVNKSFSDGQEIEVLTNINLDIHAGEFLTIIGPSGCGKSTLLRLIAGLILPNSGSIFLDNKIITGPGSDRGVVFQEARLFPWLTVYDNVAFGLSDSSSSIDDRDVVYQHLRLVGLEDFSNLYPYQLSGGMRQRVSIARA